MFELVGWATLKVCGYGWLWGRRLPPLPAAGECYGNGGHLLEIGLFTTLAVFAAGAYWMPK